MAKKRGWDDVAKLVAEALAKQAKSRGGKKAAQEALEKAKKGKGKGGPAAGAVKKPPKPKSPAPASASKKVQDVKKAEQSAIAKTTKVGPDNKPVVLPKRPSRPARSIGALLSDNAKIRQANIDSNRLLRQTDMKGAPARPDRSPNMDVRRGAPPKVGRSKSQPKGPSSQYEADVMRRQTAEDAKRMGSGQARQQAQKARMQGELDRLKAKEKDAKPARKQFFRDKIQQQRKIMGLAPEKFERLPRTKKK